MNGRCVEFAASWFQSPSHRNSCPSPITSPINGLPFLSRSHLFQHCVLLPTSSIAYTAYALHQTLIRSTHPHLRCTVARWRGREGRPGGAAGEGVEGGSGGLLAGPDRPQPRRVFLRPRRVTGPVRL